MYALYEGRELVSTVYKRWLFPWESTQGKETKILTQKQILQRLPKSLAQVKASNTTENLLSKIKEIMYNLCWTRSW